MFRNDKQIGEVNRVLLGSLGLVRLWAASDGGPSDEAIKILENNSGPLSGGEMRMLRVAFDLWNGEGKIGLKEIMSGIDSTRFRLVATLMTAVADSDDTGPHAIDEWIDQNTPHPWKFPIR